MQLTTHLRCRLSGLIVGTVNVYPTAGSLPYLAEWDRLIILHPVFGLGDYKLFHFLHNEWQRLARPVADAEITDREANTLRVAWLAVLHTFGSIKQDQPGLPDLATVQSTIKEVLTLAAWKYQLQSPRFKFPEYHVSGLNQNLNFATIGNYLQVCFEAKERYESTVRTRDEAAQAAAAKAAAEALTKEWAAPVSKKVLWAWVRHYLPEKYEADCQGWMATLFLGGSTAIVDFFREDIELLEEIIVSECPGGTGVMKAVRDRIDTVKRIWEAHNASFDIELSDLAPTAGVLVNGIPVTLIDPGPMPTLQDCAGIKAKWIVAKSKWQIAKAAFDKQQTNKQPDNPQLGEL